MQIKIILEPNSDKLIPQVNCSDLGGPGNYASSLAFSGNLQVGVGMELKSVFATSAGVMLGTGTLEKEDCSGTKYRFNIRFSKLVYDARNSLYLWTDLQRREVRERRKFAELTEAPALNIDPGTYDRYSPILVPAMGRSGTTLLMSYLAEHPEMVVPGNYPFEFRQASYLWHAARILTAPANFKNSMHPDSFEGKNPTSIGHNPYLHRQYARHHVSPAIVEWQDKVWPEAVIKLIKEQFTYFVDILKQEMSKTNARYFVEKTIVSPMNIVIRNIYPESKEIFLVRDFRDSYVSAREFNVKRNSLSFGRELFKNDLDWLRSRGHSVRHMVETIQSRKDRCIVVRYEDLVMDTRKTLIRIFNWAGVGCGHDVIEKVLSSTERDSSQESLHKTSKSPAASIGRWHRDMSLEEKKVAEESFGEYMAFFGYD